MVYKVRAPALPIQPEEYNRGQIDQFQNVLRLYFNRLDNYLVNLSSGSGGGAQLYFPNGAFHQDGVTTLTANMTNVSTAAIQVASTEGFPNAGYLLIQDEIVQYTTKTATTFDGTVTRGVKSSTNAAHTAGVYVSEVQGGAANTIITALMTATDFSDGVYLDPINPTKIYATYPGRYNVQFSTQFVNWDSATDTVTVWFRVNGTDVPYSAGIQQIGGKHGSSAGENIVGWNIYLELNAGEYFELCWSTESGNSVVATYPPGTAPVHPASPSTILTVSFVSAI